MPGLRVIQFREKLINVERGFVSFKHNFSNLCSHLLICGKITFMYLLLILLLSLLFTNLAYVFFIIHIKIILKCVMHVFNIIKARKLINIYRTPAYLHFLLSGLPFCHIMPDSQDAVCTYQ